MLLKVTDFFLLLLYTECLYPPSPKSYVAALNPDMSVFPYVIFKEVIKVKWDHWDGTLIW